MSTTTELNTGPATGRRSSPQPAQQPNGWVSMVTACMVAVGASSLIYAGVGALQGDDEEPPMDSVAVRQVQDTPIEELETMGEDQLSELLVELDRAADAHTAPGPILEAEISRIQGVWEAKWYAG